VRRAWPWVCVPPVESPHSRGVGLRAGLLAYHQPGADATTAGAAHGRRWTHRVWRVRVVRSGAWLRLTRHSEIDVLDRYVAPTVVVGVTPDSALMRDEIFGPILCVPGGSPGCVLTIGGRPVLPVASVGEAIRFVSARPRPLAAYIFSESRAHIDRARLRLANARSGALTHGRRAVPGARHGRCHRHQRRRDAHVVARVAIWRHGHEWCAPLLGGRLGV
jgi:hypothetical protein